MTKRLLVLASVLVLTACSSSDKKQNEAEEVTEPQPELTDQYIQDNYSLPRLYAAQNILQYIADYSGAKSDKGTTFEYPLDCKISQQQARDWLMPLQALISSQIPIARSDYVANPHGYAGEMGFDHCGTNCSCGLMAKIIDSVSPAELPVKARKSHERFLIRLQAKSDVLNPVTMYNCAKRETWFCGSDLMKYLEQRSGSALP